VVASIFVGKFTHGGKLNMEIVLKASLAGGVAMGAPSSIIIAPYGAMLCGFITGLVVAFSYAYLP
jgi:ammonium transporter Rh